MLLAGEKRPTQTHVCSLHAWAGKSSHIYASLPSEVCGVRMVALQNMASRPLGLSQSKPMELNAVVGHSYSLPPRAQLYLTGLMSVRVGPDEPPGWPSARTPSLYLSA